MEGSAGCFNLHLTKDFCYYLCNLINALACIGGQLLLLLSLREIPEVSIVHSLKMGVSIVMECRLQMQMMLVAMDGIWKGFCIIIDVCLMDSLIIH